jgi:cytochrome c oxidase cbb3-type subunit 1
MANAMNPDGTLVYSFVAIVLNNHIPNMIRFFGGFLYLSGMLIMLYNTFKTIEHGHAVDAPIPTFNGH